MSEPFSRQQIAAIYDSVRSVSDQKSETPVKEGGWSRREILGHLIDSALNNHQRFVRAAIDGSYTGPSYRQQEWVNIHGYRSMAWNTLVEHWRFQNELLMNVIERIPSDRLHATCRVGDGDPVTLAFLIEDYASHLHHHIRQILNT